MLINFNHLKTFYNALVHKMKAFRGNWNQNDPSADDYIKNRPFYSEGIKEQEIVSERIVEGFSSFGQLHTIQDPFSFAPTLGGSYVVTWDGAEYEVTAANADGYVYIGNENYVFMESGGSIPFTLINTGETLFLVTESPSSSHTIKIVIKTEVVHKLDKKFIDMPDGIVTEDSLLPILEDNLAPVTFTNDYDSLSGKPAVVQYAAQTLTDDQKAIARANIGAGTGDYNDLINVPRVNFWEDDSYEATSIPGVIRQESLPDGYPYVTYTAGELISTIATGTLTVTKNDNGELSLKMSPQPTFGVGTFVDGAKYLIVIGESSYVATCYKPIFGSCNIYADGTSFCLLTDNNTHSTVKINLAAWYNLNLSEGTHEWGIYNAIPTYQPIAEKYLPDAVANKSYITWTNILDKPEYSIILKDVDTSYRYNVFVKNGTLATSMACASIRVDSIPDKEYLEGDILDLSEAIVTAVYEDGSERQVTNFTYPASVPRVSSPEITICYVEFDRDLTATVVLPSIKVLSETLVDFEYTIEDDGTYTLTAWKGTLNGEPSTEMIIPANRLINL